MNIKYCIFSAPEWENGYIRTLATKGIIACVRDDVNIVIARYGVNKKALKKILKAL